MALHYLIFFIYLVFFSWLIPRLQFVKHSGIPERLILPLFLIKMAAGLMIGWISQKYYPGNDYHAMNDEGMLEYRLLMHDPKEFVTSLFHSVYHHYDGYFNSIGSYWNDLRNNLIIKSIAIINIFSRGGYYTNSLVFNSLSFLGIVALFRVFYHIFPGKAIQVVTGCFLIPSALYFASGIYKDLIIFCMLGFYCYALYMGTTQKMTGMRWLLLILSFAVILLIRNYVAVILLPLTAAYWLAQISKKNSVLIFSAALSLCILLTWLLPLVFPSVNPLQVITQKQQDFAALPMASSQVSLSPLEPNMSSFIQHLPQALNHGFFRPYLWEQSSPFLWPMAIELFCCQLLIVSAMFFRSKETNYNQPFILFALCLALCMLVFTGYIIPNMGSIIRYRSIYLPFLLTPLLCMLNMKRIKAILHINI